MDALRTPFLSQYLLVQFREVFFEMLRKDKLLKSMLSVNLFLVSAVALHLQPENAAAQVTYEEQFGADNPFDGFTLNADSAPTFADLDNDGDQDMVAGRADGTFAYFENTGDATTPIFLERMGTDNPLGGFDVGDGSLPKLVDLDGDGDFDLASGSAVPYTFMTAAVHYYENIGTASNATFVERVGASNPFEVPVNQNLYPDTSSPIAFGDLDGDGDLDLVLSTLRSIADFTYHYYLENIGTVNDPDFFLCVDAGCPLDGVTPDYEVFTDFVDFDLDGDLDFITSTGFIYGAPSFDLYENIGDAIDATYDVVTDDLDNPFSDLGSRDDGRPAFVDLDGDGLEDLVAGNDDGTFTYFVNTSSQFSPAVDITLTPESEPIIIPAGGGSFDIDISLLNTTSEQMNVDVWFRITNDVAGVSINRGPFNITLNPGEEFLKTMTQVVRAQAPPGDYEYTGSVGQFPLEETDSDSFSFSKSE